MLEKGDSFTGQSIKAFVLLFLMGQALDIVMSFALVHSYSGVQEEVALFGFVSSVIWMVQLAAHLALLLPLYRSNAKGTLSWARFRKTPLIVLASLMGVLGCGTILSGPRTLHVDSVSYLDLLALDLLGLIAMLLYIRLMASKRGLEETGQAALSTLALFTLACFLTVVGESLSTFLSFLGVALIFLSVLRVVRVLEMFVDPAAGSRASTQAADPSL